MNPQVEVEFLEAVHSREHITGLTHGFYRYPARFSPLFARAAIKLFTKHGDIVLDPFMGGGTTLVEARALGRRPLGTDINSLANFISLVKTTPLKEKDLLEIRTWINDLIAQLNLHSKSVRATEWIELGYQRNINGKSTWPIRKILELALAQIEALSSERQQRFARCILLKTAQWALDCRTYIPTASQFRQQLLEYVEEMINGAVEYAAAVNDMDKLYAQPVPFRALCLHRSVVGIETEERLQDLPAPALILTSPPYPGVHVLYHRWQIQGRKETPAPYWIADCLDGNGASFYTFGDRKRLSLSNYYEQAQSAFTSLARIADHKTVLVQLVAFSDPSWQLPQYLNMMENAGFVESEFSSLANSSDGRLWRSIPHRKWYADQRGEIATSKEVVLFHRLA